MQKSQINAILVERTKRRKTILAYAGIVLLCLVFIILFGILYFNKNKNLSVGFVEDGNIDYKVYLKENPYYKEKYLASGNDYLENLIDYIDTNFKYNIAIDQKNINFDYNYKIDANVEVKTKNSKNPIYTFEDNLVKETSKTASSTDSIKINEPVKIDYNHYNDLIKDFVSSYGLDGIDATLKVSMTVNTSSSCEGIEENADNSSVISLIIPLTTKTVDINISDNLVENKQSIMLCNQNNPGTFIFLILFVIGIGGSIVASYLLVKFILDSRTPEDVYHTKLSKILSNYGSYIQEIDGDLDLTGYESWKIKSFEDMMEISDRINEPILMIEQENKTGVFFIIPAPNKRVYHYGFKVEKP